MKANVGPISISLFSRIFIAFAVCPPGRSQNWYSPTPGQPAQEPKILAPSGFASSAEALNAVTSRVTDAVVET